MGNNQSYSTDTQSSLALHQTLAILKQRTRVFTNQQKSPQCQANSNPRHLSTLPLQNPILFPQRNWQNVMEAAPTENATLQSRYTTSLSLLRTNTRDDSMADERSLTSTKNRAKSSMSQATRAICQADPTTVHLPVQLLSKSSTTLSSKSKSNLHVSFKDLSV